MEPERINIKEDELTTRIIYKFLEGSFLSPDDRLRRFDKSIAREISKESEKFTKNDVYGKISDLADKGILIPVDHTKDSPLNFSMDQETDKDTNDNLVIFTLNIDKIVLFNGITLKDVDRIREDASQILEDLYNEGNVVKPNIEFFEKIDERYDKNESMIAITCIAGTLGKNERSLELFNEVGEKIVGLDAHYNLGIIKSLHETIEEYKKRDDL